MSSDILFFCFDLFSDHFPTETVFNQLFLRYNESLYNAINGTCHKDPEALTITTIENALYMGLKNDVSFIIEDVMNHLTANSLLR